jgi:transcriptional regulator with XRE-family HTH domain/tetratricopeptide (TPR) repeat protein
MAGQSSQPARFDQEGFGKLLRAHRMRLPLTQEGLAERAGLSERTLRNLEGDRIHRPYPDTIRRLADALNLTGEERRDFEAAARQVTVDASPASGSRSDPPGSPPCQLPPDVADFTGRSDQVALVRELLCGTAAVRPATVVVLAMAGKAGVGKTALAVHVAHQLRDAFPDGQLYVNLRGAEPHPLEAAAVLARFLRSLGLDGAMIPVDQDEREALYRACLADRRVLVVLDNAAGEAQVRPLLPGTPGCAVLVTSRARLVGLEAARLLDLEVLQTGQAVELLARIVGAGRVAAEAAAAAAIADYCGRLPLAVRIAGARLAARPHWSLGQLASLLADERGRLDELAAGDLEVRASLALSYEALSGEQQRAFRLLGLLDVGDFPAWVAGPLLGIGHQQAEGLVEQLADAQLLDLAAVDPTGAARYRFHDLVRIYAKERATAYDAAETWRAVGRVTAGWLALAEQADARLPGVSDVITTGGAARWLLPAELVDQWLADPLAWFERERTNLVKAVEVAAATGLEEAAWELAGCLTSFFLMRSYWLAWDHVHEVVLTACRQAGNRRGEAAALTAIGYAMAAERLNDHPGDGQDRLSRAIEIFRELGDRRGEAKALHALAELLKRIGISQSPAALQAAIDYATQSLHLAYLIGDLSLQADALLTLGGAYRYLRQPAEAIPALEETRRLTLLLGARHGQAMTLWHLAMAARDAGNTRSAGALLEQSLDLVRELEDRRGQARLLLDLGQVRTDEGRLEEADELLGAAVAAWPSHTEDYSFRAKALDALGRLRCRQGRYDQAADHFAEAASRWGDLSADAAQDESLEALGDALAGAGCSQEQQQPSRDRRQDP